MNLYMVVGHPWRTELWKGQECDIASPVECEPYLKDCCQGWEWQQYRAMSVTVCLMIASMQEMSSKVPQYLTATINIH